MTIPHAADRLDDSFPHGTPAGWVMGCRGSGGCPNRATTRMTCTEARTRYASDRAYKRAIDAGQMILDRDTPIDTVKETTRDSHVRRALPGIDSPKPKPTKPFTVQPVNETTTALAEAAAVAAQPDPVLTAVATTEPAKKPGRPWKHGTEYAYGHHGCRCELCTAAKARRNRISREHQLARRQEAAAAPHEPTVEGAPAVEAPEPSTRYRHRTVSGYDRHGCRCAYCCEAKRQKNTRARASRRGRIEDGERLPAVQQQLADARLETTRLQAQLALAEQRREEAETAVLELTVENSRLRAAAANATTNLQELVALTRRPDSTVEVLRPPSITFDLVNGDLVVSMRGLMQTPDVATLRTYLGGTDDL